MFQSGAANQTWAELFSFLKKQTKKTVLMMQAATSLLILQHPY